MQIEPCLRGSDKIDVLGGQRRHVKIVELARATKQNGDIELARLEQILDNVHEGLVDFEMHIRIGFMIGCDQSA